jgi:hypothetical protein
VEEEDNHAGPPRLPQYGSRRPGSNNNHVASPACCIGGGNNINYMTGAYCRRSGEAASNNEGC